MAPDDQAAICSRGLEAFWMRGQPGLEIGPELISATGGWSDHVRAPVVGAIEPVEVVWANDDVGDLPVCSRSEKLVELGGWVVDRIHVEVGRLVEVVVGLDGLPAQPIRRSDF